MITIDLDLHSQLERITAFNLFLICKKMKEFTWVRHSASGEGLHVLIGEDSYNLRFWNDQTRADREILRKKHGLPEQILFDEKLGSRSGAWIKIKALSLEDLWQAVWKPLTLTRHEFTREPSRKGAKQE